MTFSRLFTCLLLGSSLALAPATFAAKEAKDAPPAADINEHDRLVQEFMAERAKLIESRQTLKAQAQKAKKEKNQEGLRAAQDKMVRLEREFAAKNAALIGQLKASEDRKKPKPTDAKKSGG